LAGPAARAAGGGSSQRGFDHALESLVAKCSLLAGVRSEVLQVIRRDAGVEPPSIGIGAFGWVASEREVERVRRNERIASATQNKGARDNF